MNQEIFAHYKLNIAHLDIAHWDLLSSMKAISRGETENYFTTLAANLEEHFAIEEEFMLTLGYPFLVDHQLAHHALLHQARKIATTLNEKLATLATETLYQVFIQHIDHYDRQIAEFVDTLPK